MQSDMFYGEIWWTKMTKIVILPYFPYKTLGEVKIWSFVQEISSLDKSDNTFLDKNLSLEHD
jgi:hypothetical protein